MAYVATHRNDLSHSFPAEKPRAVAAEAVKPGFWRRLFMALLEARQRKANELLGQYLIRSGGRLTDDIEREMNHRLSRGDWNFR